MTAKKKTRITRTIATGTVATPSLSIFIENRDGVHTHKRNGEIFSGNQARCRLCQNGSPFEKAIGKIGA